VVGLRASSGNSYWIGAQIIGGYEHEWASGFFTNLGIGAGVGHFDDGDNGDEYFDLTTTFPYPTGNLLVGYKF